MAGSNDSARNERRHSSVTRRQVFPLFGATALATVSLRSFAAEQSDVIGRRSAAKALFVYVGTYTFPGTARGGTHQSQARAFTCSG